MNKIYFAQFYNRKLDGTIDHALGSDSVLPLDGRLSSRNMENAIYSHIDSLKALNKGYTGFSLHYGTYTNNRTIQAYKGFSNA